MLQAGAISGKPRQNSTDRGAQRLRPLWLTDAAALVKAVALAPTAAGSGGPLTRDGVPIERI
jgi:hypothetical protein